VHGAVFDGARFDGSDTSERGPGMTAPRRPDGSGRLGVVPLTQGLTCQCTLTL
jgi:hypothetical protein